MNSLPSEIKRIILTDVPVTCRCVSKEWNSVIFKQYLQRQSDLYPLLLEACRYGSYNLTSMLMSKVPDPSIFYNQCLICAYERGYNDIVTLLRSDPRVEANADYYICAYKEKKKFESRGTRNTYNHVLVIICMLVIFGFFNSIYLLIRNGCRKLRRLVNI